VLEALLGGVDRVDIEASLAQAIAQQDGGVFIVIDNQDVSVHSEVIPFCRQVSQDSPDPSARSNGGSATRHEPDECQDERDNEDDLGDARRACGQAGQAKKPKELKSPAINAETKNAMAQKDIGSLPCGRILVGAALMPG